MLSAFRALALILVFTSAVVAQQPAAPPSPQLRALSLKLQAEINGALECTATALTLQDRIKELEDRLAKAEPGKPGPAIEPIKPAE